MFRTVLVLVVLGAGGALPERSWAADEATSLTLDAGGAHRLWVIDNILMVRAALFDGDTGNMLAVLSGGARFSHVQPFFSPDGAELYVVETHYSRTWRGERTDIVAVYDGRTLELRDEISIPPKHAMYPPFQAGSSALSDDGRFLAVFNMTPATSVTLVDVRKKTFLSDVSTPGCYMVFAGGDRRFAMLCGDGTAMVLELNEDGSKVTHERSKAFFDPDKDPVMEKGARYGNTWLYVSFDGFVHGVDVASNPPQPQKSWSLFTDEERAAKWRVGGKQNLAVNGASGLLFTLVHQGGPDTHKQAGTEIWIYDLKSKQRVRKIEAKPAGGVNMIGVSPDAQPVLFAAGGYPQTVSIYDARSGEHLRDLSQTGLAGVWLEIPRTVGIAKQ